MTNQTRIETADAAITAAVQKHSDLAAQRADLLRQSSEVRAALASGDPDPLLPAKQEGLAGSLRRIDGLLTLQRREIDKLRERRARLDIGVENITKTVDQLEGLLRCGAYKAEIAKAQRVLDAAEAREAAALANVEKGYKDLAAWAGIDAALELARRHGRDVDSLLGIEPEPEPEPEKSAGRRGLLRR